MATPASTQLPRSRSVALRLATGIAIVAGFSLTPGVPTQAFAAGTTGIPSTPGTAAGTAAIPAAGLATSTAKVERMHDEAEAAYRASRWSQALAGFNAVVAIDPDHAKSWLRIGNVQQRRRQWVSAAGSYRKAARQPAQGGGADDVTRAKALLNLATVNVELARAALAEFDRIGSGSLPDAIVRSRDEIGASIDRTNRNPAPVDGVAREPGSRTTPAAAVRRPPGAATAPSEGAEPRPSALQAVTDGADSGTASRAPVSDLPPPRPEVEYLRGAPKP